MKLVGDWIDRGVGDLAPAWDVEAMADAVAAAHAAGARVAVHTFAEESVAALVRAGVDSVEHGTGLSDDGHRRDGPAGHGAGPDDDQYRDASATSPPRPRRSSPGTPTTCARCGTASPRWSRAAHEAGVPIYVGTDAGGGIGHGLARRGDAAAARAAGMSTMDVLRAGSWGAREWLGFPGLVEGGLADLVVYARTRGATSAWSAAPPASSCAAGSVR